MRDHETPPVSAAGPASAARLLDRLDSPVGSVVTADFAATVVLVAAAGLVVIPAPAEIVVSVVTVDRWANR